MQDYYLREDRMKDRKNSDVFFDRLRGNASRSLHTSSTIEDVSRSASSESAHMTVIQNHFLESPSSSTEGNIEIPLLSPQPLFTSDITIEWGSLHPHKNVVGTKVPWSSKELEYVGNVIEELTEQRGELPKNINSLITDRIFKDTKAHPIFHSHHTLDSTRVRWGIQAYQKKKEKERKNHVFTS